MDGASTLVLHGSPSTLPMIESDAASLDGTLVLRLALPPTFSSFGTWQNFTVVKCHQECQGGFDEVIVELVHGCAAVEAVDEIRPRQSVLALAISLTRPDGCLASNFWPPFFLSGAIVLQMFK